MGAEYLAGRDRGKQSPQNRRTGLGAASRPNRERVIYLDHNASSPLLLEARAAWLEAEERFPGNPSSPHRLGARADNALEEARRTLGQFLGCGEDEVVWTSGATEACNTVLHHVAHTAAPDAAVWLSATEHLAVLATARHFFGQRVQFIPVDSQGIVNLDWLHERLTRTRPALVAVMAANNETGVLQPWRAVQTLCASHEIPFFCDATQWCGRAPSSGLGAAMFVAGSAHKFGGPRGVGFLKIPTGTAFQPLLRGGKQQERRRAGTENVPGVLAMLAALDVCERELAAGADASHRATRDAFERKLLAALPTVRVNSATAPRLWNTSSVTMPDVDCRQRWVVKLDKAGFATSTGSACASGTEEPSHVLTAMGFSAGEAARVLRFSAGWRTPPAAWDDLLATIVTIQTELERGAATPASSVTARE